MARGHELHPARCSGHGTRHIISAHQFIDDKNVGAMVSDSVPDFIVVGRLTMYANASRRADPARHVSKSAQFAGFVDHEDTSRHVVGEVL